MGGDPHFHAVKMTGHPFEDMAERQKGHGNIRFIGRDNRIQAFKDRQNVAVVDHRSFGRTGCTRCIDKARQVFDLNGIRQPFEQPGFF